MCCFNPLISVQKSPSKSHSTFSSACVFISLVCFQVELPHCFVLWCLFHCACMLGGDYLSLCLAYLVFNTQDYVLLLSSWTWSLIALCLSLCPLTDAQCLVTVRQRLTHSDFVYWEDSVWLSWATAVRFLIWTQCVMKRWIWFTDIFQIFLLITKASMTIFGSLCEKNMNHKILKDSMMKWHL